MVDSKKINLLVMRSVLILIPVFVVPALLAVYIIRSMNLDGAIALVPLVIALLLSWTLVFKMMSWSRRQLKGSEVDKNEV